MYDYLKGKIVYKNNKYIILEANNKGYKIFVINTNDFEIDKDLKIFVYHKSFLNNKNNQIIEMFGFKKREEKYFFELLLSIIGIGTKTSLLIMMNDIDLLKKYIVERKINDLCSLQNINKKIAFLLVNQLCYKFSNIDISSVHNENTSEVISALNSLGYKKDEINFAINLLKNENLNDVNESISFAIKSIVNKNEMTNSKA